ncbi:type II toxin-antitoxin system death-on-curing family toxin [Mucilaginibacter jinjuensis]|uniref:Type II toxin-antitoxin system death-on-curing family toxin n=1 Tax=Mucilaginibacter jinjuensis TaxID=1176721 RepID=A0ABY7TC99_9SPHI|nr:type II toxin-antitoxin system death-on-curing family toxin [Mucilaginibacter jinjuensis]WCT14135.1 type II toxin-antitoxin system death-on-curing family toxin [Mucilaginibacter jinjuensis]
MIDLETVEQAHHILIERFGGSKGIRDQSGLEAAINRPYATFDQQDLYPTALEKSVAIFESLIINHPFLDGNKRIAYLMFELILAEDNFGINASQDEKYEMVISASTGELKFDGILQWLKDRIINI